MSILDPIQGAFLINNTKRSFYKTSHSTDPENTYGADLLAFKVVQSQVKETPDKISVFQYSTFFLLIRSTLI